MNDFPDYEAAAQSVKDAWLIDDRTTATLIALLKDAIGAALGDEPLYRLCQHCEGDGFSRDVAYKGPGEPYAIRVDCPTCKQRGFVPVWPKEEST